MPERPGLVVVRPLVDRDRAAVAAVMRAADADLAMNAYYLEHRWEASEYFVAEVEGVIAGFVNGRFDAHDDVLGGDPVVPQAWILWIVVDHASQRLGVGRELMRYLATEASVRGCSHVGCLVDESTPSAIRQSFFTSVGLNPVDADPSLGIVSGRLDEVLALIEAQAPQDPIT